MKKVLFVANHKGFSKFNAPYMTWFKQQGWQVDNASPGIEIGPVDNQYDVNIQRSPLSIKNWVALKQLKKIINNNNYDIIHVHTPMGAVIGRIASISARKKGTKVIYTAHGFHFFKGAPLLNWLLYYPIEKFLAPLTDILVTINDEDYERAVRNKLYKSLVYKIDGVGVDLARFRPLEKKEKIYQRARYGFKDNDFIGLYTAQFINRKNHIFLIENLPIILKYIPNFKLLLAGSGETMDRCKQLAKSIGVEEVISFLGTRSDIPLLCGIADIHISPSLQEGLAIGNIEAMACGCPLVISDIRGHKEVCDDGVNGFIFKLGDKKKLIDSIISIASDKKLYSMLSNNALIKVKEFSIENSLFSMAAIYRKVM